MTHLAHSDIKKHQGVRTRSQSLSTGCVLSLICEAAAASEHDAQLRTGQKTQGKGAVTRQKLKKGKPLPSAAGQSSFGVQAGIPWRHAIARAIFSQSDPSIRTIRACLCACRDPEQRTTKILKLFS